MKHDRSYAAKLLLFGEYTVLNGSRAFVIPISQWKGQLAYGSFIDNSLVELHQYLEKNQMFQSEAREAFRSAIDKGLQFNSSIPQGYGVGSSGALTAALYDAFFSNGAETVNTKLVCEELAMIEGFYHGKSSGMDPLVSWMNAPVLQENGKHISLPSFQFPKDLQVFLIDSGEQRNTGNLVKTYLHWAEDENFRLGCLRPLIQSVDHAISFLLDHHLSTFWEHIKLISTVQFEFFKPMITANMHSVWDESRRQDDFAIKLCGAGGGGYYLGFALNHFDIASLPFNTLKVSP
jgi:mevalonate kinase